MYNGIYFLLIVPALLFLVGFVLGYKFMKGRLIVPFTVLALIWLGFTLAVIFGIQQSVVAGSLGLGLCLYGINAPSGIGLLIGGSVGWFKREQKDSR
ncbi:hypothetical protein [Loktanella sp. S4079]|uniref:hypothetical protein n=1 Tax=Loktanella sp. S4079 TaxID=579483 RepID=UPI0005FA41E9|nr:hypothetical protein [Loktanella sp. S4079]KJZ20518.1 hypothetical protein TW80_06970 [Loktanella sp. S4079]